MKRRRTNDEAIFKNLRAFRLGRDLSQRECGALVGKSQITWSRWERQLRYPDPPLAKRLAKITGVPLNTILGL
jgi:transcriptional regulator with XRE-family HTH domain